MTVPIILAIIGGIALLIGLFGGGVKAKEIEIPKIPGWPRLFSTVVGIILLGISIWLSSPLLLAETATPTPLTTVPESDITIPTQTITGMSTTIPLLPTEIPIPVEISFEASETSINAGNCTVLKWNVQNAMRVYLNSIEIGGRGNEKVCPSSTTTYALGVEYATGYSEREVTISVVEVPLIGDHTITFIYANDFDFGTGFKIHAIEAHNTGTNVEFQFDYTGDVDRRVLFFDPPSGDTISIRSNIPAGTNSVLIVVSIIELQNVSDITVNFYIPGKESNGFIFLDFQAIENILP